MRNSLEILTKNIRLRAAELGFDQSGLAAASGIAQPTINLYWNGKQEPKVSRLDALSKALQCEPFELLIDPAMAVPEETEREILALEDAALQREGSLATGLQFLLRFAQASPELRAAALGLLQHGELAGLILAYGRASEVARRACRDFLEADARAGDALRHDAEQLLSEAMLRISELAKDSVPAKKKSPREGA